MMKRTELWVEYQKGADTFYIDLYDKIGLYLLLSEGGKKLPVWEGDLDISDYNLERLPDLSQIEVTGNFNVSHNLFRTFEGSPRRVGKDYIANGTRLGMKFDNDTEPVDVMEGFPASGIGGNLEIASTSIDSRFRATVEKRAGDLEIVAKMQKSVGGTVWTSAGLFELREKIQDKQCELGFVKEGLSAEQLKKQEDLKELSQFEINFSTRIIQRRTDIDERDERIKKGMNSNPEVVKGNPMKGVQKKQADDRRKQRESSFLFSILRWVKETTQNVQLAQNKNEKYCKNTADILRQIEARKVIWMKLYVLGELGAIARGERQYEDSSKPIRSVWNKVSNAFAPKNPAERGKGASLEGVKEMKQQLWAPTKDKFNLDDSGIPKGPVVLSSNRKIKKTRNHQNGGNLSRAS